MILGKTCSISGKVDANGIVKFTSPGGVTGAGKWQDLTRGGAILLASYKFSSGDQGKVYVLRGFQEPPEPDSPPDIAGSWHGTFESGLSLMKGRVNWTVHQDRTKTRTWFTGQETIEFGGARGVTVDDFVGIADGYADIGHAHIVRIGLSEHGIIVICRAKVGQGEMQAHGVWNFVDGGLDLFSMRLRQ